MTCSQIDSYINSLEYQESFGDSIVPYYRGFATQRGQKTVGFSRMLQLYRGRANSDRAQGKNKGAWLTRELAQNVASPVRTPGYGRGLSGNASSDRGQLFRVSVMQADRGGSPQIRRSMQEYLVSYEQLSPTLQRLNKQGGRIASITPA